MIKKNLLISVFIVFVIVLAGCTAQKATSPPLPKSGDLYNISEAINQSEEQLPDELPVYKVVPYQYDADKVSDIAKGLGINGSTQEFDDFYLIREDGKSFSVDKYSGSYSLLIEQPIEDMMQPINDELSNSEYVEMADKFIETCGIRREGLSEEPKVYDYRTAQYIDDTTGKAVKITILKAVQYNHKGLEGINIEGVTPRLLIAFNCKGEVVEIHNPWGYYEKDSAYPLISKEAALNLIKNNDTSKIIIQDTNQNDNLTIKNTRTVYFNDPIGYKPLYLLPYYCMEGINSKGEAVIVYVRAISDEYFDVVNPPGN